MSYGRCAFNLTLVCFWVVVGTTIAGNTATASGNGVIGGGPVGPYELSESIESARSLALSALRRVTVEAESRQVSDERVGEFLRTHGASLETDVYFMQLRQETGGSTDDDCLQFPELARGMILVQVDACQAHPLRVGDAAVGFVGSAVLHATGDVNLFWAVYDAMLAIDPQLFD